MMTPLEQAILEVIVYFDIFSYPLTPLEIWMNMQTTAGYREVVDALDTSQYLRERLRNNNGLWFLRNHISESSLSPTMQTPDNGRVDLFEERQKRYRASKHKLDKARRFAKLLRFTPGIEGVYACNSLGFLHSRRDSDIDLFVVAKPGQIWTARFFAVLLAELIGFRPKGERVSNGLCLSFFAREGASMKVLALEQDIYYLYWMNKLMPILVSQGSTERFWSRNLWVSENLPQAQAIKPPQNRVVRRYSYLINRRALSQLPIAGRVLNATLRGLQDRLISATENAVRKLQLRWLPAYLKDVANKGTSVVVNDDFLKFHDRDRRAYFREEFMEHLKAIA